MDEGPRYPGSLVVHHVKQQAAGLAAKYRRQRKRATELPRFVSTLLAWEGAIVAGAFLTAIAHVAACAYMMERFDERTRRTSLVRYYQQRCTLADETVHGLKASLDYYSAHASDVQRRLQASTTAALDCQRRLGERRRQLEVEITAWLPASAPPPPQKQQLQPGTILAGPGGCQGRGGRGVLAAVLGPWRELYVQWRLEGWRRELEALEREAVRLEQRRTHHQRLALMAGEKLEHLAQSLRGEAGVQAAVRARLAAWRAYSCRCGVLSLSGQLWLPEWLARESGVGPGLAAEGAGGGDQGGGSGGSSIDCNGNSAYSRGSRSSSSRAGSGGAGDGDGGVRSRWSWSIELYVPSWMDDDEALHPAPGRGEQPADSAKGDDRHGAADGGGSGGNDGDRGGGSGGSVMSDLLSELHQELGPLLGSSLPRW